MGDDEKKKISTFFDFTIKDDKPRKQRSDKQEKGAPTWSKHAYVVCPLCALNRPLKRTGTWARNRAKSLTGIARKAWTEKFNTKALLSERRRKYNPNIETRFDLYNINEAPFISIREARGRGAGFVEVDMIKFEDIKNASCSDKELLMPLVLQMRDQCFKILKATDDLV